MIFQSYWNLKFSEARRVACNSFQKLFFWKVKALPVSFCGSKFSRSLSSGVIGTIPNSAISFSVSLFGFSRNSSVLDFSIIFVLFFSMFSRNSNCFGYFSENLKHFFWMSASPSASTEIGISSSQSASTM